MPWLTIAILLPVTGAVVVVLGGRRDPAFARGIALGVAVVDAAVVAWAVSLMLSSASGALAERYALGVGSTSWSLAMDGLSAPLVALTALLGVLSIGASWRIERAPAAHMALLLGLQAAVLGVFLAADLVLFYVFWEAVLIPMYFLIGVWGHEQRRHAAMKFFLYTFAGSGLMLVGILLTISATGTVGIRAAVSAGLSPAAGAAVFWLLAVGFLVKVPVVPLHTWLPDAHVEAPTAGSMMLAGVLLKMGGYGMLRLAVPLAPDAYQAARGILLALGLVGIVYGAMMSFVQSDLKRLVAYSSVSHMGFVVAALGVGTPIALGAAMLGMVSHGLVAPLLFLLVGVLYDRIHTRDMARLGGLAAQVPRWGTVFVFAALASLGLPGLSGFPGEFLTVTSTFDSFGWWAVVAAIGVVPAAAYNLRAVRRVVQGPPSDTWQGLGDIGGRESVVAGTLAVGVLALGIWPAAVLSVSATALARVAAIVGGG